MKNLILMLAILTLTGCWNTKEDTPYVKPRLELEPLVPLELDRSSFITITEQNADEIFAELREKGVDPVLFGLTDVMYESRSLNYMKIIIFISKQTDQIESYKVYYEPPLETEDE